MSPAQDWDINDAPSLAGDQFSVLAGESDDKSTGNQQALSCIQLSSAEFHY